MHTHTHTHSHAFIELFIHSANASYTNRKQKTRNRNGNSNNDSAIRGNSMSQSYCMYISTLEIWCTSKSNRLLMPLYMPYSISGNSLSLSIQISNYLARPARGDSPFSRHLNLYYNSQNDAHVASPPPPFLTRTGSTGIGFL